MERTVSKKRVEDIELGQLLFGNQKLMEYDVPDKVLNVLRIIAHRIQDIRYDPNAKFHEGALTDNSGAVPFENDVFAMRAYCWCDGERHREGCPPNFEHFGSGLEVNWYKRCGRGTSANQTLPFSKWLSILGECLQSLYE
jgi:hypothetical protein